MEVFGTNIHSHASGFNNDKFNTVQYIDFFIFWIITHNIFVIFCNFKRNTQGAQNKKVVVSHSVINLTLNHNKSSLQILISVATLIDAVYYLHAH